MAWYHQISNVFRRDRLRRDVDQELAFHLQERIDELRDSGLGASDADRQARRQFGNLPLKVEETIDMDVWRWLDTAVRDLRLTVRSLTRTPTLTATIVLTLALGIGANSAVFSAIDAVLLQPLPFPQGDQLVLMQQVRVDDIGRTLSPARLEDWHEMNETFQGITGYVTEDVSELSGELPERLRRAGVAPRFLQVLGIPPAIGRDFTDEERRFGGPAAALISDRLWRRRFNADPNALGRTLRLGEETRTIVGVMPASFLFPDVEVDLWTPRPVDAPAAQRRTLRWLMTVGRLRPGVSLEQALANMEAVQTDLGRQYPDSDADLGVRIQSLKELTVGGVRRSMWLIFGAVSLLLLIACINIAALLLSRAMQRQHEIAVRVSLGASRGSIIAQRMTEALVLSLAGGALGLVLATSAARIFATLAADVPRIQQMSLDWRLVCYTLACSAAVTVLCGLLPAFTATRWDMRGALAKAGRTQVSSRSRTGWVLVGVQVALAVTLLSGAGLLLRSFLELGRVAPGFDTSRVLAMNISVSWAEADPDDPGRHLQWTQRMLDGLRAVPGVEASAIAYSLPGLRPSRLDEFELVERPTEAATAILAENQTVSADYFATLQIPLLAGELCDDNTSNGMVNRRFADLYLNGSDAIGYHLRPAGRDTDTPGTLIRGVVGDARENGLDQAPLPTVYHCSAVAYPTTLYLVRTSGDPAALGDTLRRQIQEIDSGRSVFDIVPLAQHLNDARGEDRLRTTLLSFFAATAILLASLGLYGTLGYVVGVRRREVGLRLALGAERDRILRHFLAQGLGVSVVGALAGLALTLASGGVLQGMLYGVSPADPSTLVGVILLVLTVTAAASLLPAIRASRVEPMHVLRDE